MCERVQRYRHGKGGMIGGSWRSAAPRHRYKSTFAGVEPQAPAPAQHTSWYQPSRKMEGSNNTQPGMAVRKTVPVLGQRPTAAVWSSQQQRNDERRTATASRAGRRVMTFSSCYSCGSFGVAGVCSCVSLTVLPPSSCSRARSSSKRASVCECESANHRRPRTHTNTPSREHQHKKKQQRRNRKKG